MTYYMVKGTKTATKEHTERAGEVLTYIYSKDTHIVGETEADIYPYIAASYGYKTKRGAENQIKRFLEMDKDMEKWDIKHHGAVMWNTKYEIVEVEA